MLLYVFLEAGRERSFSAAPFEKLFNIVEFQGAYALRGHTGATEIAGAAEIALQAGKVLVDFLVHEGGACEIQGIHRTFSQTITTSVCAAPPYSLRKSAKRWVMRTNSRSVITIFEE